LGLVLVIDNQAELVKTKSNQCQYKSVINSDETWYVPSGIDFNPNQQV
jgi:hypothetical protein